MSTRSLNKVMLIGNMTRDVDLKYTPSGTAVATFGLATNRGWTTDAGERNEDVQFHRIVAWSKLAEICGQLLFKGRKIYIEGRLQTRKWTGQDGQQRENTEIVAENMMILDNRTRDGSGSSPTAQTSSQDDQVIVTDDAVTTAPATPTTPAADDKPKPTKKDKPKAETDSMDEVNVEDIPF